MPPISLSWSPLFDSPTIPPTQKYAIHALVGKQRTPLLPVNSLFNSLTEVWHFKKTSSSTQPRANDLNTTAIHQGTKRPGPGRLPICQPLPGRSPGKSPGRSPGRSQASPRRSGHKGSSQRNAVQENVRPDAAQERVPAGGSAQSAPREKPAPSAPREARQSH